MRLIDADALEKYMTDIMPENTFSAYGKGVHDILTHLINFIRKEMPTIEAEPVRHGKLLEGKTFNDQHCSVCGQRFRDDISFILPSDENGFPMPKRCPECGCYWDGGADNG